MEGDRSVRPASVLRLFSGMRGGPEGECSGDELIVAMCTPFVTPSSRTRVISLESLDLVTKDHFFAEAGKSVSPPDDWYGLNTNRHDRELKGIPFVFELDIPLVSVPRRRHRNTIEQFVRNC